MYRSRNIFQTFGLINFYRKKSVYREKVCFGNCDERLRDTFAKEVIAGKIYI